MKHITLHRVAVDNTVALVDAGTVLVIGDADEAKTITEAGARALIDSHGAVDPDAIAAEPTVETPVEG